MVFLSKTLERNPSKFLPIIDDDDTNVVEIDLNKGMESILEEFSKHPVKTRLSLSGPLIVAEILHMGNSGTELMLEKDYRNILSNTPFIMLDQQRLQKDTRLDLLDLLLLDEWMHSLASFKLKEVPWSCWLKATVQKW